MRANFLFCVVWGLLLSEIMLTPVPQYLKHLQEESEKSIKRLRDNTNRVKNFHSLARSYSPSSVETDSSGVTLHFGIPDDELSQYADREVWLVLSSSVRVPMSVSINVRLTGDSTQRWDNIAQHSRHFHNFIRFDITQYIPTNNEASGLAIQINAMNSKGESLVVNDVIITTGVEQGPLLVVAHRELSTKEGINRISNRGRRTLVQYEATNIRACHLQTWRVPTVDLNWQSWVIYPVVLSLNMCVGKCPTPLIHESLNPSNHALARTFFRTFRNGSHPEIQCVPITFRVMTLLLQNGLGNYTLASSDDLSATRCGCR